MFDGDSKLNVCPRPECDHFRDDSSRNVYDLDLVQHNGPRSNLNICPICHRLRGCEEIKYELDNVRDSNI